MKLKILSTDGTEKGSIEMPEQFTESVRKDVIKRAVEVIESNKRQPYGAKKDAGLRASANLSRRRHDYRGAYGHGISRVPRKILSRNGTRFNWVGAVVPGTVGGRRAHPPKSEKILTKKINSKENRLAIRSALSASLNNSYVLEKGHKIPENYPFVLDDSFVNISKTKELLSVLLKLGLGPEFERTKQKKVRAGKGKSRGRRYIRKTGPLIVVLKNTPVVKAAANITGFETISVENLNASILAPGGLPGRLVLYTKSALEKIKENKLFTEERIKINNKKTEKPKSKSSNKKSKKVSSTKDLKNKSNIQSKNESKSDTKTNIKKEIKSE